MAKITTSSGLLCAAFSFIFFSFCRYLRYRSETKRQKSKYTTTRPRKPIKTAPRWTVIRTYFTDSNVERCMKVNISISYLHAFIASCIALYSFLVYSPEIYLDPRNHITWVTYLGCSFSFGYFCYDLVDVLSNRQGSELLEMTLHHVVTIAVFSVHVIPVQNIGYQMIALFAEVNSVFLHLRKLLHLYNVPRENPVVRATMLANVITFVVFRLGLLTHATISIIRDKDNVGSYYFFIGACVFLPVMWIMNPILFYRIVRTDFLKKSKTL